MPITNAVPLITPDTLREVKAERRRQVRQWGGPDHDDQHEAADWLRFIDHQLGLAREELVDEKTSLDDGRGDVAFEIRDRLVKIAALAVAAIDSLDRKEAER